MLISGQSPSSNMSSVRRCCPACAAAGCCVYPAGRSSSAELTAGPASSPAADRSGGPAAGRAALLAAAEVLPAAARGGKNQRGNAPLNSPCPTGIMWTLMPAMSLPMEARVWTCWQWRPCWAVGCRCASGACRQAYIWNREQCYVLGMYLYRVGVYHAIVLYCSVPVRTFYPKYVPSTYFPIQYVLGTYSVKDSS
jgi:hypothetical protein